MSDAWNQRLGFWWIAEDHPLSLAVVASPEGPRTYSELADGAHQLVHLFRASGAKAGDPVAALLPNGLTMVEVSLACQEAGLLFLPLNNHLTATELAAIIEHSGTRVLVIGAAFANALAELDTTGLALTIISVGPSLRSPTLADVGTSKTRSDEDNLKVELQRRIQTLLKSR